MVIDIVLDIDKIENYLKENNLSKTQFCKLAKISSKTLNKV